MSTTTTIADNLSAVLSNIQQVVHDSNLQTVPRLVAVSKTKPIEMLVECYEAGQRHFGENYAQELISKATSEEFKNKNDIRWHFIGPLQSNKAASLVKNVGPQLFVVETVSTLKLATKLNNALDEDNRKLNIFIQVNTSGEDTKSGVCNEEEVVSLATDIINQCPNLVIKGLMTIGAPGDFDCFDQLVALKNTLEARNELCLKDLELSMGMSGDYEEAIQRGSTNVRVGSTIFGARDYSSLQK